MKTKLIATEKYYLLVDKEAQIKANDKITVLEKWVQTCLKVHDFDGIQIDWNPEIDVCTITKEQGSKILAHLPKSNAPVLELVLQLPEFQFPLTKPKDYQLGQGETLEEQIKKGTWIL